MQQNHIHGRLTTSTFPSLTEALALGSSCFPPVPPQDTCTVRALAADLRLRLAKTWPSAEALNQARELSMRRFMDELVLRRNVALGLSNKATISVPEPLDARPARTSTPVVLKSKSGDTSDTESFESSEIAESIQSTSDSEAALPKGTAPEATHPTATPPEAAPPEAAPPGATLPEVTLPKATPPEVALSEATPPEVALSEATPPDVTLPKVTLPKVTLPKVTLPKVAPPRATPPETKLPETTLPGATPPETTPPGATPPGATVPGATVPGANSALSDSNDSGVEILETETRSEFRASRPSILRRRSDDFVQAIRPQELDDLQSSASDAESSLSGLVYHYETDASRSVSSRRTGRASVASVSRQGINFGDFGDRRSLLSHQYSEVNQQHVNKGTTPTIQAVVREIYSPDLVIKSKEPNSVERRLDFAELDGLDIERNGEISPKDYSAECGEVLSLHDESQGDNFADLQTDKGHPTELKDTSACDDPSERVVGTLPTSPQAATPRSGPANDCHSQDCSPLAGVDADIRRRGSHRSSLKRSSKKRRPLAMIDCNQIANLRVSIAPIEPISCEKVVPKCRPERRKRPNVQSQAGNAGMPRQWRELKHLDVARARKAIERGQEASIERPEGSRDQNEIIRRSKRQRFPVLKFWKGETIVYERRKSQIMPTIAEIVLDGSDEDDSTGPNTAELHDRPSRKRSRYETVS
jgi:hypothetical protein